MPTVDIMMATYNGAPYLAQQLRSLQNQTYKDWQLIIHDDGSTDNTLDIVRAFQALDPRITLIEDHTQLHNAGMNFLHTLKYSKHDFCMFCDQDDIWLETKIEKMVKAILRKDNSIPQVLCSNSYMYNTENERIEGHGTIAFPRNLKEVLFSNGGVQGCAFIFNRKMTDILCDPPEIIAMHDHVLTLAAFCLGEFSVLNERLMLYRRHVNTETGYTTKNKKDKAKLFFKKGRTVLDPKHLEAIKSFYRKYQEKLDQEKKAIFHSFFSFENHSRLHNAGYAMIHGFSVSNSRLILMAKLLIRPLL
ncbi:MAG: glycosyltransferase [Prevotella sp.]|nr:glycosyltransferase [Prevotella sp.]